MSEDYLSKCVNCGRQVFLDGETPNEKCYWCHKPARIKEGNMTMPTTEQNQTTIETNTNPSASSLPKTRKERLDEVRKLRGKRCLTCPTSYLHEGTRYCPVKSCPSHIPKANRPPYRANESAGQTIKPAVSSAKAAQIEGMRAARGKKCQTCAFSYGLKDSPWCLVEKCPSRVPVNIRLKYKPKDIKSLNSYGLAAAGDKPVPLPPLQAAGRFTFLRNCVRAASWRLSTAATGRQYLIWQRNKTLCKQA